MQMNIYFTNFKSKIKDLHSPLSFRHFILGAIAIFIYVGVEIGIPSTANLFMTKISNLFSKKRFNISKNNNLFLLKEL